MNKLYNNIILLFFVFIIFVFSFSLQVYASTINNTNTPEVLLINNAWKAIDEGACGDAETIIKQLGSIGVVNNELNLEVEKCFNARNLADQLKKDARIAIEDNRCGDAEEFILKLKTIDKNLNNELEDCWKRKSTSLKSTVIDPSKNSNTNNSDEDLEILSNLRVLMKSADTIIKKSKILNYLNKSGIKKIQTVLSKIESKNIDISEAEALLEEINNANYKKAGSIFNKAYKIINKEDEGLNESFGNALKSMKVFIDFSNLNSLVKDLANEAGVKFSTIKLKNINSLESLYNEISEILQTSGINYNDKNE